jgi:hypothetical protein
MEDEGCFLSFAASAKHKAFNEIQDESQWKLISNCLAGMIIASLAITGTTTLVCYYCEFG